VRLKSHWPCVTDFSGLAIYGLQCLYVLRTTVKVGATQENEVSGVRKVTTTVLGLSY